MLVLAFDTSSRVVSVALCDDDHVLARRDVEAPPAEGLLGWVDEVLAEARVAREAVELVAVGTGPGLFTGTRVGVATAKGIAFALGRPLVGVSSLVAVRCAASADGRRIDGVMIDAGRGEVYALGSAGSAGSAADGSDDAPFLARPEVARARLSGSLVASASLGLDLPAAPTPDAAWVAREGRARFVATGRDEVACLEPDYVRPSDATLPKTPQRTSA
jgi:tRNA threonylcarbamoyladenosine biosynthesis protein TsaB